MQPQVNIAVAVDVVGALSTGTLRGGHLCLMDDSGCDSQGQGTPDLCTVVRPGQVVQWSAVPLDVQTPVAIRRIVFLGPEQGESGDLGESPDSARPDLAVWSGVVPADMPRGVPQRYRLELRMSGGESSLAYVDTPSLLCP